MERQGPILEKLTRRLAETPPDFLDEPRIGTTGRVFVPALVNDLLSLYGARAPAAALMRFHGADAKIDRNRLALAMITVWLLADEWFVSVKIPQADALRVLDETVTELAAATAAHKFVNDTDRREELARVVLARLNYRPARETIAQATDRLSSLSSTERRRLLEASRAAERRARAIREALAKKAAEESADKWTRECATSSPITIVTLRLRKRAGACSNSCASIPPRPSIAIKAATASRRRISRRCGFLNAKSWKPLWVGRGAACRLGQQRLLRVLLKTFRSIERSARPRRVLKIYQPYRAPILPPTSPVSFLIRSNWIGSSISALPVLPAIPCLSPRTPWLPVVISLFTNGRCEGSALTSHTGADKSVSYCWAISASASRMCR